MQRRIVGLVATVAIGGTLALACGSGPLDVYESRSSPKVGPSVPLEELASSYEVPPDRALIPVIAVVTNDAGFTPTADRIRAEVDALTTALSDTPGCSVRVLTYTAPERYDDDWTARSELVVDVVFAELADVRARMDRLDACTAVVAARLSNDVKVDDHTRLTVSTNDPTYGVDAPETHLAALADRAVRQHQAAAAISGAPQVHAEDLRCVPSGRVNVGRRSISGVQLVLDMPCRIPADLPPPGQG